MNEKRLITEQEETAYRLCSQDFANLSKVEASKVMGVSVRRVQKLLANVQQKAPSLPIVLSRQQSVVQHCINDFGKTYEQTALILGITEAAVASTVKALKDKGVFLEKRKRTVPYEKHMDSHVRETF